ncbi:hypothetical protein GCM10011532_25820 [Christiangramia forsetii]|uniref:Pirin n=1 Tax=Christiangramia forsetii TaxID=411153 RepID=A0ABQ1WTG5_9FLAO|nr:hypothetical protein GCM10011532_25820 [Christiangramia forsetii]
MIDLSTTPTVPRNNLRSLNRSELNFKNMSNTELIIKERAADIGNFMVGRLLPFRQKRAVGPFTFIDHMGPARMSKDENLDVPPHPHIGLSTLTYLFEGSIVHKDSLGSEVEIKPGSVNWMTAGKGVVHSERTPGYLRDSDKTLHGLQIWVALPKNLEQMQPTFAHFEEKDIPHWSEQGAQFKLIAGKAFGKVSPVPVHSELYFIEIKSKEKQQINIGKELYGESALYILEGSVTADGHHYGTKQILVAKESTLCSFDMEPNTTLYVFGGIPFEEERFLYWNFVNSDKEVIEKAKKDWKDQNLKAFPKVPGDEEEYVPLPKPRKL